MKEKIAKIISEKTKLKKEMIEGLIEIPPSAEMGDFAFPCFVLAKEMKKAPQQIALELAREIKIKGLEKIEAKGPYLNFFVDRKNFALELVEKIVKEKEKFGKGNEKGKIMIEFSQANTHKAFHVGHIRGTSLGESLSRIREFSGNNVTRANYQGDTGMHVAKWLWNYTKNHNKEKIKVDESWIAGIYVDAVKRLADNEKLQEEVDIINKKLEEKSDKNLNELWKKTRKICLDALEVIYRQLNTHFDKYYFESEVEIKGKEIAQELVKKKIAVVSDGATIMNLEDYGLSVWVLLRKDGTVLYSSKDLALIEKKFKENKMDKCIYVVADEQNLHFQQLFKTLDLMNFKDNDKCRHVNYGMVRLPTGKMSSRTGDNILYSDFMKELREYSEDQIKKRYSNLKEKEIEKRALAISLAAIKYSMLAHDSNKIIVFSKEDALSFEGNTGPYLLYSYVRANSILKKIKGKGKIKVGKLEEREIELVKKLGDFPTVVKDAAEKYNPALIAHYSYELAQIFNTFYHECPVLNSENEEFRLALVKAFAIVMKISLNLLGIETIDEM